MNPSQPHQLHYQESCVCVGLRVYLLADKDPHFPLKGSSSTGHCCLSWFPTVFLLGSFINLLFQGDFIRTLLDYTVPVKWSRSVTSDSLWPHRLQPTSLLSPWNFPGKSTGGGCHFLLQYCPKSYTKSFTQSVITLAHCLSNHPIPTPFPCLLPPLTHPPHTLLNECPIPVGPPLYSSQDALSVLPLFLQSSCHVSPFTYHPSPRSSSNTFLSKKSISNVE